MEYFTYALKSLRDGTLYIGMTSDTERRLKQHNAGKTSSNRHSAPFEIIYTKSFESRTEAREHEEYLKSGSGRESLKRL